jgi:hypothetical protein
MERTPTPTDACRKGGVPGGMTCAYISRVMIHLHPRFRVGRTSLVVRLLALLLSLGVALAVPVTAMAEGVACAWGMAQHGEHGAQWEQAPHGGHGGFGAAAAGATTDPHAGHHHGPDATAPDGAAEAGQATSSEAPPHPCPCPHPCGPCAVLAGAPVSGGTVAFLSHPVQQAVVAWDVPSLPIFDPLLVPSGPDPPTSPFLR